jgi:hypothetical protein
MKTFGQAVRPEEVALEAAIREAKVFRGGTDARYAPVSGGISNSNWKVCLSSGLTYFVKLPGNGTEMFIDRAAALEASAKAASAGLGPRVYDDLAVRGIEINDFITDRRPSTHRDFTSRDLRMAAATQAGSR